MKIGDGSAALSANTVADHTADGVLVVDALPVAGVGAGHIPGSFANRLRPVFTSWIGWLTESGRPLIFALDLEVGQ